MSKLTTVDIITLVQTNPLDAVNTFDEFVKDKEKVAAKEGFDEGYNHCRSSYNRIGLFGNYALGIAAIGVLGLVIWIFFSRVQEGLKLDAQEVEACRAGNYAQCLAGAHRDSSRETLLREIYFQSTGKQLLSQSKSLAQASLDYDDTKEIYTLKVPRNVTVVIEDTK